MMKDDHNTAVKGEICAGCGMHKSSWEANNGKGYLKGGETYCCKDCAEGIECVCGL